MTDFVYKNKLIVLIALTLLTLIVGSAYNNWMDMPVRLAGAPEHIAVTRRTVYSIMTCNGDENKFSSSSFGYGMTTCKDGKHKYVMDAFSKEMAYGLLKSCVPITDESFEFVYSYDKCLTLMFVLGKCEPYSLGSCQIWVSFNRDGEAIVTFGTIGAQYSGDFEYTGAYYYQVDPDKLTRVINRYIAYAEKMYPEQISQQERT